MQATDSFSKFLVLVLWLATSFMLNVNVNVVAFTLQRAATRPTVHSTIFSSRQNFFRLRSSLSLGPGPSPNDKDEGSDDLTKWERMYNENAPKKGAIAAASAGTEIQMQSSILKSDVRVVSFDLDNTIWKTSNVINAANDALADHMASKLDINVRVEKIMGTLFKANKAKYCPLSAQDLMMEREGTGSEDEDQGESESESTMNLDHIKAPTLLTQLRKDAIMEVLKNEQKLDTDEDTNVDLEVFAEEAFQVWTNARHDAIPLNLASSVLECLDEIRSLTTKHGNPVVVGAITDGNSDPRKVSILQKYFDFVVNAERIGVSKPDRRIYDAAIVHVSSDATLNHVFESRDSDGDVDLDVLLDQIGPWWIHIGDDFVKDIVACKDINMRSIWSRELVLDKLSSTSSSNAPAPPGTSERPPRTETDLKKDISENKTLRMIIGTEDYVLESIQGEFADAVVDNFGDVCKVISMWHEEGLDAIDTSEDTKEQVDLPDYFSIVLPDDNNGDESGNEKVGTPSTTTATSPKEQVTREVSLDVKFCIMCGEKLPIQAKFCSSCGNQQP